MFECSEVSRARLSCSVDTPPNAPLIRAVISRFSRASTSRSCGSPAPHVSVLIPWYWTLCGREDLGKLARKPKVEPAPQLAVRRFEKVLLVSSKILLHDALDPKIVALDPYQLVHNLSRSRDRRLSQVTEYGMAPRRENSSHGHTDNCSEEVAQPGARGVRIGHAAERNRAGSQLASYFFFSTSPESSILILRTCLIFTSLLSRP